MKKLTSKQRKALVALLIRISIDLIGYIGFFSLWGSVGALEVQRIGYQQFIVQCIIGITMMAFSRYSRYKIYEEGFVYE